MTEGPNGGIREFYQEYLPTSDCIAEMFYATWMVVIALGILNVTEQQEELIPVAIALAFGVNITWGLIDGLTVILSTVIDRAKSEQIIYDLRTKNDRLTRQTAHGALEGTIASVLSEEEKDRIIKAIASGVPGNDPHRKRYSPRRADWYYALGIFGIDFFIVIPIIAPLLIISRVPFAIYASRSIATIIFAFLGAVYAKNLNRNRWLAALFLGTLGFCVFSLAYFFAW